MIGQGLRKGALLSRKVSLEERNLTIVDDGAFDSENPQSLVNLLPESIKENFKQVQNHFLQDLSDESLRKNIRHTKEYKLVRKLRQSFWLEYNHAVEAGRKMQMTRIWQGITINSGEFYSVMKKEHFAAFIFTRPLAQNIADMELLEMGTKRMYDILRASPYRLDSEGKPTKELNPSTAKVQIDLFKHIDERVRGGVIKKVQVQSDQRSLNVNVTQDNTARPVTIQPIDLHTLKLAEDLTRELTDLRERTRDIPSIAMDLPEEDDDQLD